MLFLFLLKIDAFYAVHQEVPVLSSSHVCFHPSSLGLGRNLDEDARRRTGTKFVRSLLNAQRVPNCTN